MVQLSETHGNYLKGLSGTVQSRLQANLESEQFYTGEIVSQTLNIAVPPHLANQLGVASDWPATVVDSYAERMHFIGWRDGGSLGMADVTELSGLQLAVTDAVLDSLIYGVGFIAIEPDSDGVWSAQAVPPTRGTVIWDYSNKRPVAGMRGRTLFDGTEQTVLYLPEGIAYLEGDEVVSFAPHGLGAPTMWRIRNSQRSDKWYGRSMITAPVRYFTVAACRTMEGMELNREFYTYPQRWLKNGTMDMFVDSDNPSESERVMAGFRATTGSMLTLPPPAEPGDPEMELHQFSSSPPTPFIDQIQVYSQLMASATGIPAAYLGFSTENPPSADAIRAWLDRLILGCRNQQGLINPDLRRLGWMALNLNGQRIPWREFTTRVKERWEEPATPSLSSTADALGKLKAAEAIDITGDWAQDMLRVPDGERARMRQKSRMDRVSDILTKINKPVDAQAEQMAMKRDSDQ